MLFNIVLQTRHWHHTEHLSDEQIIKCSEIDSPVKYREKRPIIIMRYIWYCAMKPKGANEFAKYPSLI